VQTFLFATCVVVNVIPPAIPATIKPEFLFHSCVFLSQR
jgi:magnesium-transporting ATPase (P-type)